MDNFLLVFTIITSIFCGVVLVASGVLAIYFASKEKNEVLDVNSETLKTSGYLKKNKMSFEFFKGKSVAKHTSVQGDIIGIFKLAFAGNIAGILMAIVFICFSYFILVFPLLAFFLTLEANDKAFAACMFIFWILCIISYIRNFYASFKRNRL